MQRNDLTPADHKKETLSLANTADIINALVIESTSSNIKEETKNSDITISISSTEETTHSVTATQNPNISQNITQHSYISSTFLLNIPPACSAIKDAANVAMGLYTADNANLEILIPGTLTAFTTSMALSQGPAKENSKEIYTLIKTRQRPENWPDISAKKQATAISLTTLSILYGPPSDAVQAYFFLKQIPVQFNYDNATFLLTWDILSGTIAAGSGINSFLTESIEALNTNLNLLVGRTTPYSNKVSAVFSPSIGGLLSSLKVLQDAVQGYITIKSTFGFENMTGKIVLISLNGINMFPSFCFYGKFNINSLDKFFGYIPHILSEPKSTVATKCVATLISSVVGTSLSYLKMTLNESFYHQIINDFNLGNYPEYTKPVASGLSKAMFVQESLQWTSAIYPLSYALTKTAIKKSNQLLTASASTLSRAYSNCIGFWSKPNDEEKQPLLHDSPEARRTMINT